MLTTAQKVPEEFSRRWFCDSDDSCAAAPLHQNTQITQQHHWSYVHTVGRLHCRQHQGCIWPLIAPDRMWFEVLLEFWLRAPQERWTGEKKGKEKPAGNAHLCPSVCPCVSFPLTHRHRTPQRWRGSSLSPAADMSERSILFASQTNTKSILIKLNPVCCHVRKRHKAETDGIWSFRINHLALPWSVCVELLLSHIHSRTMSTTKGVKPTLETEACMLCFVWVTRSHIPAWN